MNVRNELLVGRLSLDPVEDLARGPSPATGDDMAGRKAAILDQRLERRSTFDEARVGEGPRYATLVGKT
jgi:hypothetical protein